MKFRLIGLGVLMLLYGTVAWGGDPITIIYDNQANRSSGVGMSVAYNGGSCWNQASLPDLVTVKPGKTAGPFSTETSISGLCFFQTAKLSLLVSAVLPEATEATTCNFSQSFGNGGCSSSGCMTGSCIVKGFGYACEVVMTTKQSDSDKGQVLLRMLPCDKPTR